MLKEPQLNPAIAEEEDVVFAFGPESRESEIEDYKEFWNRQKKILKKYHEASQSGTGFVQMYAGVVDKLVSYFYQRARNSYFKKYEREWEQSISLVALGGYGRNELSPQSDVDLMLLYSEKISSKVLEVLQEIFNEEIVHSLWDLKMKVNFACRTVGHTIADARKNFKVKNTQMDGRLICGSNELFEIFREKYENYFKSERIEILEDQCIAEKRRRHRKYDFTIYMQEPDIKSGVGGIMDYQTICWLGRARLKVKTMDAIESHGLLGRGEIMRLERAYNFLLRTRNELYFQNGGASNLLNVESQAQVALGMGYVQREIFTRVKTFMSDYYEQTRVIYELLENFEKRLRKLRNVEIRQSGGKAEHEQTKKYVDGFIITSNRITYKSRNIFIDEPVRLLRVFRYVQQYHLELSDEIKELIKESVHLIDESIINHPGASCCFCSILQALGEVYPILMLMHELGVLCQFIPEFREITHLVQAKQHHQYTVDIHTLNTTRVLDEIFRFKKTKEKRYYDAIKNTTRPWLLYLLLLLHDLGKANGIANHMERGVRIGKPVLDRLGIGFAQQEQILFVIKNNLRMVRFWQRYDVDDPQVPAGFALFVGDADLLNFIYVQTYCDMMATKQSLWNGHKELLHTKLFEKTMDFLVKHEGFIERRIDNKKDLFRESLHKFDSNITQSEAQGIIKLYPDDYFLLSSPLEFDLHIQLFGQAAKYIEESSCSGSLVPVVEWEYDINTSLTVVTVVTWDRTGLLANLSGALLSSGFNILEARTFVRADQMSILVFRVMESSTSNKTNEYLQREFQENLNRILVNNGEVLPIIDVTSKKQHRNTRFTRWGLRVMPRMISKINVDYEPSSKKTYIEIQSADRKGLLYQFSKSITRHGFNIIFSRTVTEYGEGKNIFHVHKNNVGEVTTAGDLVALRESLNEVVNG